MFLSYQTTGFSAQSGSANIYDTRLGIYAGYHKNAADAYVYADYGYRFLKGRERNEQEKTFDCCRYAE